LQPHAEIIDLAWPSCIGAQRGKKTSQVQNHLLLQRRRKLLNLQTKNHLFAGKETGRKIRCALRRNFQLAQHSIGLWIDPSLFLSATIYAIPRNS